MPATIVARLGESSEIARSLNKRCYQPCCRPPAMARLWAPSALAVMTIVRREQYAHWSAASSADTVPAAMARGGRRDMKIPLMLREWRARSLANRANALPSEIRGGHGCWAMTQIRRDMSLAVKGQASRGGQTGRYHTLDLRSHRERSLGTGWHLSAWSGS